MSILAGFLYGLLGGCFAELLGLFRLRRESPGRLPEWLKSWFYWLVTMGMTFAGGLLVTIYLRSGISLQPILAVNVGASAPLIIGSLVSQVPSIEPGKID